MSVHISTTHSGSLPRTDAILAANAARAEGRDQGELDELLTGAVDAVVARQKEIGIDIPNDGEYGHTMSGTVDYGAWWNYIFDRLGGLEATDTDRWADSTNRESSPGNIVLTSFQNRRDRQRFRRAYEDPTGGVLAHRKTFHQPKVAGPLTFTGEADVTRDVDNLKAALANHGYERGFVASLSPGSCARIADEYYNDDDALLEACALALREEYKLVLDAGLTLQIDDPSLAESWDQITPEPSVADYQAYIAKRIAAINTALEGLDTASARLHVCWGSWHGPHTTDIPFRDIVDVVLEANVGGIVFEAGNVRHEHEWTMWKEVELPAHMSMAPGVVSHATNVVEHPDLVAQRLVRFAEIVGPERVIATTDCGLGGRVHEDIAWAKLESLTEGARRASALVAG